MKTVTKDIVLIILNRMETPHDDKPLKEISEVTGIPQDDLDVPSLLMVMSSIHKLDLSLPEYAR